MTVQKQHFCGLSSSFKCQVFFFRLILSPCKMDSLMAIKGCIVNIRGNLVSRNCNLVIIRSSLMTIKGSLVICRFRNIYIGYLYFMFQKVLLGFCQINYKSVELHLQFAIHSIINKMHLNWKCRKNRVISVQNHINHNNKSNSNNNI